MTDLAGKKVLITGAAAGIGFHTAKCFSKARSELILTDIDEKKLEEAAVYLRGKGATVHTYAVDVSNREKVEEMAADVIDKLGGIDILLNNAGIGYSGELVETGFETWRELMDVNFWGPLYHVYAFLPSMVEQGGGQIANVSSGQAFLRLPTWGAYASIKLALGAFSEILRYEVRKLGIKVTTIYPGMVDTGFYSGIEGDTFGSKLSMKLVPYYSTTPEKAAKTIFKAIKKGKAVEMSSIVNDAAFYARFLPLVHGAISAGSFMFLGKDPDEIKFGGG